MAGRLGVACPVGVPVPGHDGAGPSIPLVCPSVPHPLLASMSGTFWYEQDRLARAFLVDATPLDEMVLYRRRFDALSGWLGSLFGPPTTAELPPDWAGARPLPDRQQLAQLLAGRARLSMTWQRPEAIVSLWLAGENGRAVVVIGMYGRSAPAASCAPEAINEALLDLFPPAAPAARARA
ncbi:MAG: hypothetical protein JWM82_3816, partial [Myxococcales bacterium]|nr:hypothetical protein [Myxococcales bacterium]